MIRTTRGQALAVILDEAPEIRRYIADVLTEGLDGGTEESTSRTANALHAPSAASGATIPSQGTPRARSPRKQAKKAAKQASAARKPKARTPKPAPAAVKASAKASGAKRPGRKRQVHDISEFGDVSGRWEGLGVAKAVKDFASEFGFEHEAAKVRDALEAGGLEAKPSNLAQVRGALKTYAKRAA